MEINLDLRSMKDLNEDGHRDEKKMEDDSAYSTTPRLSTAAVSTKAKPPHEEDHDATSPSDSISGSSWSSTLPSQTEMNIKQKKSIFRQFPLLLLRTVFLDLPLVIVFGLFVSTHVIEKFAVEYILPQMDLQNSNDYRADTELTYYNRHCTADDATATDAGELVVDYDSMTIDDTVDHINKHGAQIYPNILSPETAQEVKDFILRQNMKNEDMIYVIANENRWSFGMRVDQDPSVTKALKEVLSNKYLVDALENIMGPDPAVIEFTGITAGYGAAEQHWHADVVPEGNGAKWARNFVPSYSLFIPLQNTTGVMGATEVCPGSHMCATGCYEFCPTEGIQVSGSQDNWPVGWGALVNQQTFHRGTEHMDPNSGHRSLFIITFAPRPRFGDKQVETRMIGQGGSYSLHWTQWGHTLSDFRESARYMQQPWRTLRSLGIYKPHGRHWGWDWVSQSSARISNNELGFYWNDLREYLGKGGLPGIPLHLHGKLPPADDSSRTVWVKFYSDTLKLCRDALLRVHVTVVGAYLALLLGGSFLLSSHRARSVASGLGRLITAHLIVLFLAWNCISRVENSSWGKNIRAGRLYRWPEPPHGGTAPSLDATLPTLDDIMIFDDMQSEYLASYTHVLDSFHPGNRAWFEMVADNSVGFDKLTPAMQRQVCTSMLHRATQQGRRVLVKNSESQWARAEDERALRLCHKDLIKAANPFMKLAIRQLDFQLTECKFGYWRDTAMHKNYFYMPSRLLQLQDKVMQFSVPLSNATSSLFPEPGAPAEASNLAMQFPPRILISTLAPLPVRAPILPQRGRSPLPPEPEIDTSETWIEEGQDVEAAYGQLMSEWYRAYVIGVHAEKMTWDVEYESGDTEESLCTECVRPFVPYRKGEKVDWLDEDDLYSEGQIVEVYGSDSKEYETEYDVEVDGRVIKRVTSKDLRRSESIADLLVLGSRVLSKYPGEDTLYPGVIDSVNSDGTFGIQFDDGDYLEDITLDNLSLMPKKAAQRTLNYG